MILIIKELRKISAYFFGKTEHSLLTVKTYENKKNLNKMKMKLSLLEKNYNFILINSLIKRWMGFNQLNVFYFIYC